MNQSHTLRMLKWILLCIWHYKLFSLKLMDGITQKLLNNLYSETAICVASAHQHRTSFLFFKLLHINGYFSIDRQQKIKAAFNQSK